MSEKLREALDKAFQLGQTYWRQADSESYSDNRRADVTRQKFEEFKAETIAALALPESQGESESHSGELHPAAPCDAMHQDWPEERKKQFDAAMGKALSSEQQPTPPAVPAEQEEPVAWAPEEVAKQMGIRWVSANGVHGRPTDHDVREFLESTPTARSCACEKCKAFYAHPSPVPAEQGEPVAWVVERAEGVAGYGKNKSVTLMDATKPEFWVDGEIAAGYTVTPLYAHPSPVPAGMKLVPVEPTKEMIAAGMSAWCDLWGTAHTRYKGIYKAMLAAAPEGGK